MTQEQEYLSFSAPKLKTVKEYLEEAAEQLNFGSVSVAGTMAALALDVTNEMIESLDELGLCPDSSDDDMEDK